MPRGSNLASMTIEALLKLRDDVGAMLTEKTHELRKQLSLASKEVRASPDAAAVVEGDRIPPRVRN